MIDIDREKVWAMDPKVRTWHTYKALPGTKVRPFFPSSEPEKAGAAPTSGGSFVALRVESMNITEIAAYSPRSGNWVRQVLHEPANGEAVPVASDELFVLYRLGGHAYAFSALTGAWDSVDLGIVSGPRVERLGVPGMAIVKGSGPLLAYDARTGRVKKKDVELGREVRGDPGSRFLQE